MGIGFIARQPNGLLCRHSNVADCITHWNFTEEDYLNNYTGTVIDREQGQIILDQHVEDFSEVLRLFRPINMTQEDFEEVLIELNKPVHKLMEEMRDNLKIYRMAIDKIGMLGHVDIDGQFEKAFNNCLEIASDAVKKAGDDE